MLYFGISRFVNTNYVKDEFWDNYWAIILHACIAGYETIEPYHTTMES